MPNKTTTSGTPQQGEYHVASFIAQVLVPQISMIQMEINNVDGAEVHATSPEGKIVFTIEARSQQTIGKHIDKLKYHPEILTLSPIYHQYLNESPLQNSLMQ